MSNKTQLQTNNTALDGYIARINAAKEVAASLPEAGGGSGGSVETCTVTVTTDNSSKTHIYYTSINDNGEPVAKRAHSGVLTVVCNTAIGVHCTMASTIYTGSGFSDCNPSDWDYLDYALLLAPSEANAQAFLNCIDDS